MLCDWWEAFGESGTEIRTGLSYKRIELTAGPALIHVGEGERR